MDEKQKISITWLVQKDMDSIYNVIMCKLTLYKAHLCWLKTTAQNAMCGYRKYPYLPHG